MSNSDNFYDKADYDKAMAGIRAWDEAVAERFPEKQVRSGWIGVDFDGTLAEYHGWLGPTVFGAPIPTMVDRVNRWLTLGYEVRVVTARASPQECSQEILAALGLWMVEHIGCALPITTSKDFDMIELWDDRCVQVIQNTGEPVPGQVSRVEGPPLGQEPAHEFVGDPFTGYHDNIPLLCRECNKSELHRNHRQV